MSRSCMYLCPFVSYAKPCSTDDTMFRLGNCDIYHSMPIKCTSPLLPEEDSGHLFEFVRPRGFLKPPPPWYDIPVA